MPRDSLGFLRIGAREARDAELMRRNFISGILKVSFWWHSRQVVKVEEPRTETMPGRGEVVEHEEQVGRRLLCIC